MGNVWEYGSANVPQLPKDVDIFATEESSATVDNNLDLSYMLDEMVLNEDQAAEPSQEQTSCRSIDCFCYKAKNLWIM